MICRLKQVAIILLSVFIAITFSSMLPGSTSFAKAKAKKLKPPTKIQQGIMADGKFEVSWTYHFKYNKCGDLVDFWAEDSDDSDNRSVHWVVNYKYKKGKKASATVYSVKDIARKHPCYFFTFNKAGCVTKCKNVYASSEGAETTVFKYNKKGVLTSATTTHHAYSDGRTRDVIKYTTTYKKGVLTQVISKDYDGTTTRKFNRNGLVTWSKSPSWDEKGKFDTTKTKYTMNGNYVKSYTTGWRLYKVFYSKSTAKTSQQEYCSYFNGIGPYSFIINNLDWIA